LIALENLGFRPYFATQLDRLARPDLVPARIAADGQNAWHLAGCRASVGELSGRLRGELVETMRPVVGDWVAVADDGERAVIHHLLDRRTAMIRRAAFSTAKSQMIAANVDCFGIVTSANRDFNVRRIERYMTAIYDSGASPVMVLNKVDLVENVTPFIEELAAVALGVPVIQVSALTGAGIAELRAHIGPGTTFGLIGSSGVGKSSLANRLIGQDVQHVSEIRGDDARGRHTTTRRELLLLPGGGVLIDTPGMRELGLIEDGGGVDAAFADIAEAAEACRFADCGHESEPGCAVRAAIAAGTISPERWASYRKLQREVRSAEARRDPLLAAQDRKRWKTIHKAVRAKAKVTGKP